MSEKILGAIGPPGRPLLEINLAAEVIGDSLWLRQAENHERRVMIDRSLIPQLIIAL